MQATYAATLFDEWIALGLRDVVRLSRFSFDAARPRVRRRAANCSVHVRIDERSAGFFALGRALATTGRRWRSW